MKATHVNTVCENHKLLVGEAKYNELTEAKREIDDESNHIKHVEFCTL